MFDFSYVSRVNELVQLLGVVAAIYVYWESKRREQVDRQKGTFDSLSARYIDYLRLCLENIEYPVFDTVTEACEMEKSDPNFNKRVEIIFCELISLLESAFILYKEHRGSEMHRCQWVGWRAYAADYFRNRYFVSKWTILSRQFDLDFVNEMEAIRNSVEMESALRRSDVGR
jgi:hypothetical protein